MRDGGNGPAYCSTGPATRWLATERPSHDTLARPRKPNLLVPSFPYASQIEKMGSVRVREEGLSP